MSKTLLDCIHTSQGTSIFASLYGAEGIEGARRRYISLIEGMFDLIAKEPAGVLADHSKELSIFTAPGRTELGGNHTDHNRGKVLAASIQLDVVAVVVPRKDTIVIFRSTGYPDVRVDLSDLSPNPREHGTTEALVRGVAAELAHQGVPVKGFIANADSTVLPGSGISSSAALEVLLGKIFDTLYSEGKRSALEIAQIGQKAENSYFGKPSGLMDQTACASGGAVAIDFADAAHPRVKQIRFDLESAGYSLCVVNTRGSHADLTPDYAAIPHEMQKIANFFGKPVLGDLHLETILAQASELRKAAGDRALLRAIHFFNENHRVDTMTETLNVLETASGIHEKQAALKQYLTIVNESGDSSWELLQNNYAPNNPQEQGISIALAITKQFFHRAAPSSPIMGACRVHGGGFAGTIQAYIPLDCLDTYKTEIESIFGPGALTPLRIRPIGAAELTF